MNLDTRINAFLEQKKFTNLTRIQAQTFPVALAKKDLIGLSKTGTGKTLAYLFPIFVSINPDLAHVQSIVLLPTQELVLQTYQVAKELQVFFPKLKLQRVAKGQARIDPKAHLLFATVGRLEQLFLKEHALNLEHLTTLVIDEADMMLEQDSLDIIEKLRGELPNRLQLMVFSATLPVRLTSFMNRFMHHPKLIKIDKDQRFDPIHHHYLIPLKHPEERMLRMWLMHRQPSLVLIFVKDYTLLISLSTYLNEHHHRHLVLHGKLSVRERQQRLKSLQSEDIRILLATDVAARGLDLAMVSDVISFGIPNDVSFFTHRSGRTGRAGRSGNVYTFYRPEEDVKIRQLLRQGIEFNHTRLSQEGFKALKPYDYVFKRKPSALDQEIQKRIKAQPTQVKPGYKKKLSRDIEQLKRQHRRKLIQENIKKLQKEKAKEKQRSLRSDS